MPGALVSRYSFTAMPRSSARPAFSARAIAGRTPTPMTTKSASSVVPSLSVTRPAVDARDRVAEMEHHAVGFVQRLNDAPDLRAHHALERHLIRRDDINGDAARPQRCRHFEPDETGADDHRALRPTRALSTMARLSAKERR